MRKAGILIALPLAALMFACASASTAVKTQPKAADQQKMISRENVVTVKSTVVAIDLPARIVTIKGPKGNVFDLYAGEEVKNLPQVKAGDEIVITYQEAASFRLLKAGEGSVENREVEAVTAADPGQKPGATAIRMVTLTATIEAIDQAVPSVTLKGAEGKTLVIIVADRKNLEKVKVGDQVVATFSRAVVISVEPPAAK